MSTNTCDAALEVIIVFLRENTFHWRQNEGDSELILKLKLRPQSRVKYTVLRTDLSGPQTQSTRDMCYLRPIAVFHEPGSGKGSSARPKCGLFHCTDDIIVPKSA